MKRLDAAALALICAVGLASLHAGAADARTPDLRGFGRVTVTREILGGGDGQAAPASGEDVVVFRFECETPQNAETVAGKFLMDLHSEDGVSVEQTTTRQLVACRALSMVSVRMRLTGSSSVSRKARRIS